MIFKKLILRTIHFCCNVLLGEYEYWLKRSIVLCQLLSVFSTWYGAYKISHFFGLKEIAVPFSIFLALCVFFINTHLLVSLINHMSKKQDKKNNFPIKNPNSAIVTGFLTIGLSLYLSIVGYVEAYNYSILKDMKEKFGFRNDINEEVIFNDRFKQPIENIIKNIDKELQLQKGNNAIKSEIQKLKTKIEEFKNEIDKMIEEKNHIIERERFGEFDEKRKQALRKKIDNYGDTLRVKNILLDSMLQLATNIYTKEQIDTLVNIRKNILLSYNDILKLKSLDTNIDFLYKNYYDSYVFIKDTNLIKQDSLNKLIDLKEFSKNNLTLINQNMFSFINIKGNLTILLISLLGDIVPVLLSLCMVLPKTITDKFKNAVLFLKSIPLNLINVELFKNIILSIYGFFFGAKSIPAFFISSIKQVVSPYTTKGGKLSRIQKVLENILLFVFFIFCWSVIIIYSFKFILYFIINNLKDLLKF